MAGEISGFWAGAQDHGAGFDLQGLAVRVGGWDRLIDGGEQALIFGGLAVAKAQAWMRTPPRSTWGTVLTLADDAYPANLRALSGPPPVLCVEGNPAILTERAIAVVGTREATGYGRSVARQLGGDLAAAGITVVSGLARGIDGEAHWGGLSRTVAVVGHGLDHTAPASHARLRREIVANGGAIVSVWADGFEPRPYTFVARNPWISGLSKAVVVVEAPERSGALWTAQAAGEQGRDVWAVPGPIGAASSRGCLELLASGAGVVVDIAALVKAFGGETRPGPEAWLQALYDGATVDAAARLAGRSTADLLGDIARREIRGELVRLAGQRYARGGGR